MALKSTTLQGVPQFERALRRFKEELLVEFRKVVASETLEARNNAILLLTSPSGDHETAAIDTGQLRQSIHPRFKNNGLTGEIFTTNRHAPFIEFGTGTRNEVPPEAIDAGAFKGSGKRHAPFSPEAIEALSAWARRHGFRDPQSAAWAIARNIYRRGGMPPRPFIYPSIKRSQFHFVRRLTDAIKRLEKRHTKKGRGRP